LKKNIYWFIRLRSKVTRAEFLERSSLSPTDLRSQFAVLKTLRLIKKMIEDDQAYLITWQLGARWSNLST